MEQKESAIYAHSIYQYKKGYVVCNGCGVIERLGLMVSYPYGEYYCHTCDEEFNRGNFDWQQDC